MNIPKTVRVGSSFFSVEFTTKPIKLNGDKCGGLINYNKHTILLNTEVHDQQGIDQAFLHEIVHAIFNERNFNPVGADLECIVDEISLGFDQIILDNPEMFRE